MSNIATALKAEIQRIARKEIRAQTESIRKSTIQHRHDIAVLKREIKALENANKSLRKASPRVPAPLAAPANGNVRFSAKGLQRERARLGLSANDLARLVGASGQSIYNWESGQATPRAAMLTALAALRTLGKREARAQLVTMA